VWLLTCAHVFFLKSDPDDEEAESEFVDNVEVEYKAAEAGGRSVTVKLKEKNVDEPAQAAAYNAKRQELGSVGVELDWEERALPSPERIRPVQLEGLEGFIRFENGEGPA